MQSRKIDETQIPQGGDMAQIAMAVAAQQQKNMIKKLMNIYIMKNPLVQMQ